MPPRVHRVGPKEALKTAADAARAARDGDTVEIEAGNYPGDVAVWTQRNLTIRGVGGIARFDAAGRSAEGKGIFVVRGDMVTIENLEFSNCRVPSGNGAGIRLEAGQLTINNVSFSGNENGILTGNNETSILRITNSSFVGNGTAQGSGHNLYVGRIARFEAEGSYFARASGGHLLKSRARENIIRYNRLTDESTGQASYELEFSNGGIAYVVGNLIEQAPNSPNNAVVSFGAEGLNWPIHNLVVAHNTIVNNKTSAPQSIFVRVSGDAPVQLINNLFVGPGQLQLGAKAQERGNRTVALEEFSAPAKYDFRLRAGSRLTAPTEAAGSVNGVSLNPAREYVHPHTTRGSAYRALPGAFQVPGP